MLDDRHRRLQGLQLGCGQGFALRLRIQVEQDDHVVLLQVEVDDAGTATLASSRKPHSDLHQAARPLHDIAPVRHSQQFRLELQVAGVIHEFVHGFRELGQLDENHRNSVLPGNTNARLVQSPVTAPVGACGTPLSAPFRNPRKFAGLKTTVLLGSLGAFSSGLSVSVSSFFRFSSRRVRLR